MGKCHSNISKFLTWYQISPRLIVATAFLRASTAYNPSANKAAAKVRYQDSGTISIHINPREDVGSCARHYSDCFPGSATAIEPIRAIMSSTEATSNGIKY